MFDDVVIDSSSVGVVELEENAFEQQRLELQLEGLLDSYMTICSLESDLRSRVNTRIPPGYPESVRYIIEHAGYRRFDPELLSMEGFTPGEWVEVRMVKGISDILRTLWEAIKEYSARLLRFVKDSAVQFIQNADGLTNSIGRLESTLDKRVTNGLKPPYDTISISGGSRLHLGGVISPSELAKALENTRGVFSKMRSLHLDGSQEILDTLEQITKLLDRVDSNNARRLEDLIFRLNDIPTAIQETFDKWVRNYRDVELPGGQRFTYKPLQRHESSGVPTKLPSVKYIDFDTSRRGSEYTQAPAADPSDTKAILDGARKYLEDISEDSNRAQKIADRFEELKETGNRILNREDTRQRLDKHISDRSLNILLRYYALGVPGDVARISNYQFSVARACVAYMRASIKAYR